MITKTDIKLAYSRETGKDFTNTVHISDRSLVEVDTVCPDCGSKFIAYADANTDLLAYMEWLEERMIASHGLQFRSMEESSILQDGDFCILIAPSRFSGQVRQCTTGYWNSTQQKFYLEGRSMGPIISNVYEFAVIPRI